MPTPSIQTLTTDAQQVLNLDSISAVRSVVAVALANANTGTPLNPNLTTQQLWNEFYQVVTKPKSDIESIIANQLMKFLFAPPAPGGAGADKQVIFNDGGVLAGAANLYWDKANNRVGIGTASPAETLTVAGKIRSVSSTFGLSDVIAETTAGTGTGYARLIVKTADREWRLINDASTSGSPFIIYDATANAESLRIATAGVYTFGDGAGGTRMTLNATGLGVGTVGPVAKLEVNSASITDVDLKYNMVVRSSDAYTTSPKSGIAFAGFFNGSANIPLCGISGGKENGVLNDYGSALYFSTRPNGGSITTRLTIDSSGNVGIGVTPSAWISAVKGLQVGAYGAIGGASSNFNMYGNLYSSAGGTAYLGNGYGTLFQMSGGQYVFYQAGNNTSGAGALVSPSLNQSMTLDTSGNLLLGTPTLISNAKYSSLFNGNATYGIELKTTASSGTSYFVNFFNSSTVQMGVITGTGTTVSYVTSSDYRLKEDVKPLTGALNRVACLKPSVYKWKADGSSGEGFLAHELAEVVPLAVNGEKDAVNEDGSVKPQGVDYSKVVPVLVAAIQELTARVQTLETR